MRMNRFLVVGVRVAVILFFTVTCDTLRAGWETYNPFVGVTYSKLRDTDVHPILGWTTSPLRVDVMEIDLDAEGISFTSTPANGAATGETNLQTTMDFMVASDTQIAINTTPYSTTSSTTAAP